jgi:hypothetical protein
MPNIVGVCGQIGSGKDTVADKFVQKGYCKVSLADPMKRFAHKVFGFTEDQLWGPSDRRNAHDRRYAEGSEAWAVAAEALNVYGMDWISYLMPEAHPDKLDQAFVELTLWLLDLEENHPKLSPRVCLQTLGTEWGRAQLHEDVWVDCMNRTADALLCCPLYKYDRVNGIQDAATNLYHAGVVVADVRFENELEYFRDRSYKAIKVIREDTDAKAENTGVKAHKSEMEQKGFDETVFSVVIHNNGTLEQLLESAERLAEEYATE